MRSQPTVRIRRAIGRIIPPKTARITRGRPSTHRSTSLFAYVHTLGQGFLLSWRSIWIIWPLLQESLCNPTIAFLSQAPRLGSCRLRSRDCSRLLASELDVKVSLHPAQASRRPCEGPVSSHTTCWLYDTEPKSMPLRGR